ncbi:MAG: hypothetical protein AVDCRST_MAG11-2905, partial [uncultured Gemmatimonadaceae bacterium]
APAQHLLPRRHARPHRAPAAAGRAHQRLRPHAAHPGDLQRGAERQRGVALPGALPAGAARAAHGRVGPLRQRAPHEGVRRHRRRPPPPRRAARGLGAVHRRPRRHPPRDL